MRLLSVGTRYRFASASDRVARDDTLGIGDSMARPFSSSSSGRLLEQSAGIRPPRAGLPSGRGARPTTPVPFEKSLPLERDDTAAPSIETSYADVDDLEPELLVDTRVPSEGPDRDESGGELAYLRLEDLLRRAASEQHGTTDPVRVTRSPGV